MTLTSDRRHLVSRSPRRETSSGTAIICQACELSSEAAIYLNDKKISLAEVPVGRTAMVQFEARKRQNVAH